MSNESLACSKYFHQYITYLKPIFTYIQKFRVDSSYGETLCRDITKKLRRVYCFSVERFVSSKINSCSWQQRATEKSGWRHGVMDSVMDKAIKTFFRGHCFVIKERSVYYRFQKWSYWPFSKPSLPSSIQSIWCTCH